MALIATRDINTEDEMVVVNETQLSLVLYHVSLSRSEDFRALLIAASLSHNIARCWNSSLLSKP